MTDIERRLAAIEDTLVGLVERLPAPRRRAPASAGPSTSLVREAMSATVDPECEQARRRRRRARTVPPQRRGGTCFAGWYPSEVTTFVGLLVDRVGVKAAAELCGVAPATIRNYLPGGQPGELR